MLSTTFNGCDVVASKDDVLLKDSYVSIECMVTCGLEFKKVQLRGSSSAKGRERRNNWGHKGSMKVEIRFSSGILIT